MWMLQFVFEDLLERVKEKEEKEAKLKKRAADDFNELLHTDKVRFWILYRKNLFDGDLSNLYWSLDLYFCFVAGCVVNYSIICLGRLQGVTWKHSCLQVRMWLNDSKLKCCLGWLLTNSLNSGLLVMKSFVKHYLMNMFFICNKKPKKRKRNGKMKRYSFKL